MQAEVSGLRIDRYTGKGRLFLEPLAEGVELKMVEIPAGSFWMGSTEEEEGHQEDEGPQHKVSVARFFMGQTPVTQAQWRAVSQIKPVDESVDLKAAPSRFEGEKRPVEQVSWYEAMEFCGRLSAHTGRTYTLPSEAQWEYACRAGTTTPFHFGETMTTELANYRGTDWEELNRSGSYGRGPKGEYRQETTPVDQFLANDFGLYDMHGNVWEWCLDDFHDNYDEAPADGSAWLFSGDKKSGSKMLRGGSWLNGPDNCRSACRDDDDPDYRLNSVGFRVVCLPQGS
ncbi:MAG: formylglycine-generating enzyme family protein [Cyanobacteria bacterium J06642_11]